jgi:catechol 2,3-dioxygenase-like lactoylglutathione lyase family enzyme
MFDHISLGVTDFPRSIAFYKPVLATLGLSPYMELENAAGFAVDGRTEKGPEFWFGTPLDDTRPATAGNGTHVAFTAPSQAAVHAFYDAALANGGTDDGPPGPRPAYGPDFYGCFVRDPDGHKVEAVCRAG